MDALTVPDLQAAFSRSSSTLHGGAIYAQISDAARQWQKEQYEAHRLEIAQADVLYRAAREADIACVRFELVKFAYAVWNNPSLNSTLVALKPSGKPLKLARVVDFSDTHIFADQLKAGFVFEPTPYLSFYHNDSGMLEESYFDLLDPSEVMLGLVEVKPGEITPIEKAILIEQLKQYTGENHPTGLDLWYLFSHQAFVPGDEIDLQYCELPDTVLIHLSVIYTPTSEWAVMITRTGGYDYRYCSGIAQEPYVEAEIKNNTDISYKTRMRPPTDAEMKWAESQPNPYF